MKNRMNARLGVLGVVAAVLTAAVVVPLVAQPEFPGAPVPRKPGNPSKSAELLVPPGVYSALVFACSSSVERGSHATLKTASGSMTIWIPSGDTIVIPMPANFTLGQQGAIVLASPDFVFASGITPSGPVSFEPVKK